MILTLQYKNSYSVNLVAEKKVFTLSYYCRTRIQKQPLFIQEHCEAARGVHQPRARLHCHGVHALRGPQDLPSCEKTSCQ